MVFAKANLAQDAVSSSRRCAACLGHLRTAPVCAHHTARSYRATQKALPHPHAVRMSASAKLQSETELFLEKLEEESAEVSITAPDFRSQLVQLEDQLHNLQAHIDDLYKGAFSYEVDRNSDTGVNAINGDITDLTEEAFGRLGRTRPEAMKQLLHDKERGDPKGWAQAQHHIQTAKLQRTRLTREIEDLKSTIMQADMEASRGVLSCHHIPVLL
ncbi:Magnesium chelatase, variant 3 [Trebouxia sp. C0010 RCD-2024]